jgi:uncharacterized metal-binding protein
MPSGRTHDRITLWSLPVVAGVTFVNTQSGNLTLLVSGGFLFSGLMFGPDLDIYSRQFQRWGWLRILWIPYQKRLRHRSFLSHGFVIGTTLRILYLASWLALVAIFACGIAQIFWGTGWQWQYLVQEVQRSLFQHPAEWLAVYIGLELGAMSHSASDWGSSTYKRFKNRQIKGKKIAARKPIPKTRQRKKRIKY